MSLTTAGTLAEWNAALKTVPPGGVLQLTGNLSLPADVTLPAGITLDLNGFTVSPPPPDATKPAGYRLFDVSRGGITIRNGTIDNAGWGAYTFYNCSDLTFTNVAFTNTRMAAVKLSALKGQRVDGIVIEDCTVTATGRPQTLFDLGPGQVGNVTIRDVVIQGPVGAESNTACDGIAIEDGQGDILIENVSVNGVPGDGVDLKNSAPVTVRGLIIQNAVRNGLKVWCHSTAGGVATSTANLEDVTIKNCGLEHIVVAAGTVTIDGLTVEAPGGAAAWGGGYEYPTDITVKNASIVRTGTSSSWLMFTDGGDSRPISSYPAKVRFENCRFWAGNSNNVFSPKAGNPLSPLSKQQALAGQWPSNFVGCTYGQSVTADPDTDDGDVTPPPPPPPPPVEPTLAERVTVLEAEVTALMSKWEGLREAVK